MNGVFSRRNFLKAMGCGTAALAAPGCQSMLRSGVNEVDGDRPNIVLILADDLGYGDLACYGSDKVKTANIDALAKGGLRFTDFHSNAPMCSPTRAALLTGRYQQRAGIETVMGFRKGRTRGMAPEHVTFAEVLKSAGYKTAIFGKWHTGQLPEFAPTRQGFDTFRGLYGGTDYHSHYNRTGHENWWKNDKPAPEQGYVTDLVTKHATDFIEQNKDNPFCVYVSHFAVHFPWQGPGDKADFLPGVDNSSREKKYGRRIDRKAAYAEMIESLDAGIGKIVSTLRRLGLEQKTLLFFASDNGGHSLVASSGRLSGYKGGLLEGGHRVPAIAYWPGKIKGGTVTSQTAMTMDLFATMASTAKAKPPAGLKLDGVDLLPLLLRGENLPRRTLFWRHRKAWAVRKGPWKLLGRGENMRLFNLADDLAEKNDLAQIEPEKVRALRAEFLTWQEDVTRGVTWVSK